MSSNDRSTATKETRATGVLSKNSYGKSRVRLSKLTRLNDRHVLKEISVDVQLQGEFAAGGVNGLPVPAEFHQKHHGRYFKFLAISR